MQSKFAATGFLAILSSIPDSNWVLKTVSANILQGSKRSIAESLDIVGQVLKIIKLPNRITQLSEEVREQEDSQLALRLLLAPN